MKISNEERREVAAWLRLSGDSLALDNCFVRFIRDTAGSDLPTEDFNAASYLANLIDCPTCKNVADPYDGGLFECSNCGEIWKLTYGGLAENHLNFCPRCGAEVVE